MLHRAKARQKLGWLGKLLPRGQNGAAVQTEWDVRMHNCGRLRAGTRKTWTWTWTWTWTCRRFWLDLVLTESRCTFYFLVPKNCQTSARPFLIDANKESAKKPSGAKSELEINQESQSNRHTACFCQGRVGAESLLPAVRQQRADVTLAQLCLGVSFWHPTILATTLNEL